MISRVLNSFSNIAFLLQFWENDIAVKVLHRKAKSKTTSQLLKIPGIRSLDIIRCWGCVSFCRVFSIQIYQREQEGVEVYLASCKTPSRLKIIVIILMKVCLPHSPDWWMSSVFFCQLKWMNHWGRDTVIASDLYRTSCSEVQSASESNCCHQ